MAPADPAQSATHSKSALLPVVLEEGENGEWVWRSDIPVEGETLRFAVISGAPSTSSSSWRVMTRDAITGRVQPAEALAADHRAVDPGPPGSGAPADYYELRNLARGLLHVSIEADEPGRGYFLIGGTGPARLLSQRAAFNGRVGQRIGLVAKVYDRDKGTNAVGGGSVTSALLRVTTPDGQVLTSAMLDDGLHADAQAGDGAYGGDFLADRPGLFTAQVVVTGQDGVGGDFVRTAEHLVPVVEETMNLRGQAATSAMVGAQRVGIRLGVAAPGATGHYRVIAEVWGASGDGSSIPVAWIGGMTTIRDGALDLALDTRWVEMAGAREPFELRNVRIEDPDYFITLAAVERVPLPMPAVPTTSVRADQIVVDEEMRMGPRPPGLDVEQDSGGAASTNAQVPPEYTDGWGHKLLLVHGYCSDDGAFATVKDQFTNHAVFFEKNANRTHDAFARRILEVGRDDVKANSYAIVAHSQGGMAALQLYAFYWSGLDNAGPGRLIQSVGTPYQGTNWDSVLVAVFGLLCGPNYDLTYDGAALWLSTIPQDAKEKVNYYTTSAADGWGYDPCSLKTDLFLDDPEDGVTEQANGQLPGGKNQGHKTGWCHTSGMQDLAQYTDASRNASMNANAAVGCYRLTRAHTGSGSDPVATPTNSTGCASGRYLAGATIQLQASPSAGSSVTSWSGTNNNSSTSTTNTVTMPASERTVTVNYGWTGTAQTLSVAVSGNGSVTSNTGGINCPGVCSAGYSSGTLVTLTATPAGGSTFAGWGGDCWTTSSCVVTMGSAHSVTATFTASGGGSHTLYVSKTGTGSGTVTSSPSGINCGSTCQKSYSSGTVVTLTASAAGGSAFTGWGGACGAAGACTVSMSVARSVTATFTQVVTPPGNTGSLIVAPGGIDVYWRQDNSNRIYHVTDKASVVDVMQNAGMPGWVWASRTQVSSLAGYTVGPEFIEGNSRSEGLLIRQVGQNEVYWVNNGLRRWVACEAALPYLGTFADVIEVPAAIINSKVPNHGSDFTNGCPCTGFSIFPSSPPSNPDSSTGFQLVNIGGVPWGCAGTWTASGDGQWLTVDLSSGTLTGTNTEDWVNVRWSTNTSPSSRSSSATVANRGFPVTQGGAPPPTCSSFEISPMYKSAGSSAGQQSVTITGYPSGCQGKSWTASNGSWVTVAPSSGSGPRSVIVSWSQNTSTSAREESVSIAGKTFTVAQDPANQPPVANAGLDQIVAVSVLTTLDGSGSRDPDGGPSPLSYAWSQVSGTTVTLTGATTASASFTPASAGVYVFELRVSDGQAQATDRVTVTAASGIASYDPTLRAPKCGSVGSVCDSGSLLIGRAGLGPEPHQPNTINASCADGTEGAFHADESNDRLRVSTLDGMSFAGGKTVQVDATVWAWSTPSVDSLEIYRAANANSPAWTLVATLQPAAGGAQTLSATYALPAGALQAVRARFRYKGSAGPCGPGGTGSYDDHDDLVFAVGAATTQGWISGKVTDTATGLPLAGVQVSAYNSAGTYVGYGQSNSAGFYTVYTGLPSGTYYARTTNWAGYTEELYNDIACVGGGCVVTSGTPISVTAGTTTTGIDFGLAPGGRISGTVTDASTGAPLANVKIDFAASDGSWVAYGITDSSGAYTTTTGLNPGTYYSRTDNPPGYVDEMYNDLPCAGGACTVTSGTPISVAAGTTTTGIAYSLTRGGRVSGAVTDAASGLPLANVPVEIYNSSGSRVTYEFTNSSGAYTSRTLPAATYYARTSNSLGYLDELYDNVLCPGGSCSVTSGTPISVTLGTTTGVSFGLAQGGRISGTVRNATTGVPLANIGVYIFPPSGGYVGYGYTDGSGVYTVAGLSPGTYYARSWDWGDTIDELYDDVPCPGWSCGLSGGAPISVTVGTTTTGIDFGLVQGGRIGGTVTNASTGLPLADVDVQIYNSTGGYVTRGTTSSSGTYTTPGVPSGTYYARTYNSLGYFDELYDNISCVGGACTVTSGTAISVTVGTTATRNFGLAQGGQISGTVTDTVTGLPLANVSVEIYSSGGSYVTSGYTNSSGVYTSGAILSGVYFAQTWNSLGYVDEAYDDISCPDGSCSVTSATPISVTVGATTTAIAFGLTPGGRISGTVTDTATGLPLGSVSVRIYDSSGTLKGSGYTNGSGEYTTSAGLPAGTYYARTSNSLGYVEELYDNIACAGGVCTVTSGSPIALTAGATTTGINFALASGGRISGTVSDTTTGAPLANVTVRIYNSSGVQVTTRTTSATGTYTTTAGLPTGTYYARTSNSLGYIEELYDNISCPGGACPVTTGTPVTVTLGATMAGVDFGLAPGGRISGAVTDAATGLPLTGAQVRIYDGSGTQLTTGTTDASGAYTSASGLSSGSYYARTANARGYFDEVYDDIPCPAGVCAPTGGIAIGVAAGATSSGINFGLVQAPVQTNDEIPGATLVSAWPYNSSEDTRSATSNVSDPVHSCGTGTRDSNTVWFRFLSSFDGTVRVNTVNSNYDTVLTAYAGTTGVDPELACNDDSNGTQQSDISFGVSSGQPYLIEVSAYGGTAAGGTLTLTVSSTAPTLSINDVTVAEGNTGTTTATFTVSLSQASGQAATVNYTTSDGTATVASDYVSASGTLTFAPGVTSQPVTVNATGDTTNEANETFFVTLNGVTNATISDSQGLGTISNDDPLPTLSITDVSVAEGNGGATMASFTVSLSQASGQAVAVNYTTADATATAGSDYLTTFGSLTIPTGLSSGSVSITVNGDLAHEANETFFLNLGSPTNATLADAQGVGTISNDDPAPTLSIGDVTVPRGSSGTTSAAFPVTLSAASYQTVTVAYATADGTAIDGTDYVGTSGSLSFPPGVTTASVSVTVNGSSGPEGTTFFVGLGSPTIAIVADGQGKATLVAAGQAFYTVTPCRAVDTRSPAPGTPLAAGVPRTFAVAGTCGIPFTARAVSLNITVTGSTSNGNVRLFPGGTTTPIVSTVNFTAGLTRANNAITRLGTNGDLSALLSPAGTVDVIIDVNGYFE